MFFNKKYILLLLFFFYAKMSEGSILHEAHSVYLVQENLAGIDFYQKIFFSPDGSILLLREQNLFLPLSDSVELGFQIPWVNYFRKSGTTQSQVGDVKIDLNLTTSWFQKLIQINWLIEYNVGSGPPYTDLNNHVMGSYGFPEWRLGPMLFKKHRYFSWHFNFYYVFRGHAHGLNREFTLIDGIPLNIFDKETYKRGFGFALKHEDAFFYPPRLRNDNLEYFLAFNTELTYPAVPFAELTFSHDLRNGENRDVYERRAPGAGYYRAQAAVGSKFFFAEDNFTLKIALFIPLERLRQVYIAGVGIGVRIDF